MKFIVTVRLDRNKDHDPQNKRIGYCPISSKGEVCTDVTGEHHSMLIEDIAPAHAAQKVRAMGYHHITRIEAVIEEMDNEPIGIAELGDTYAAEY